MIQWKSVKKKNIRKIKKMMKGGVNPKRGGSIAMNMEPKIQ